MDCGEGIEAYHSDWSSRRSLTEFDMDKIIQEILQGETDNHASPNQNEAVSEEIMSNQNIDADMDNTSDFHKSNCHMKVGEKLSNVKSHMIDGYCKDFKNSFLCAYCSFQFSLIEVLQMHEYVVHGVRNNFKNSSVQGLDFDAYLVTRQFPDDRRQLVHADQQVQYLMNAFRSIHSQIHQEVLLGIQIFSHVAVKFFLHSKIRPNDAKTSSQSDFVLESDVRTIVCQSQVNDLLHQSCCELEESARSCFNQQIGGLCSFNVTHLKMLLIRHIISYRAEYMPLPYVFQKRQDIFINVDNSLDAFKSETLTSKQEMLRSVQDLNSSFLFSVAAAIRNPKYCPDSMKTYRKIIKKFKLDGITMPMTINQLPRFEWQNPNLEICVFGFKDTGINELTQPDLFPKNNPEDNLRTRSRLSLARCAARDQIISQYSFPLYTSRNIRKEKNICQDENLQGLPRRERSLTNANHHKIDLFLILADRPNNQLYSETCTETVEHYVLCKDLGSLFRYNNRCKSYLCRHCLKRFQKPATLKNHVKSVHSDNRRLQSPMTSSNLK